MPTILTADKTIDILEAVAASPDGAGTRDLARQLGMNVATVHNIAKTLEARGYLRQAKETRRFHPGVRLMLLGRRDRYLHTLAAAARPHVEWLAGALDESIMLGVLDHGHVVNLHYIPSRQALRVQEPEDLAPIAHCTALGKLMLAHMPAESLDAYLRATPLQRFTPHTLADREALVVALEEVRKQGYSATRDELCEGVSAVAAPIADPWGEVIAAVGASAPTIRMDQPGQREQALEALQQAAARIRRAWASDL